ncbi:MULTISPECIES: uroporphyrinogen-III C-methyltransferase [Stenotrophomonas]|uniref:uroporphyrinogen-III C-methyltransferase n=1 Tax=Stenotrophomonas TaxID=40323 RepID=UPI0007029ABE|nr:MULTISPECIES: uroporphyrinogen-III C-methyltransferase [Stenotrophomonas]KRG83396.1 uroporphyrin-III methyltransferase [Stenotrophomonas acidaminiphila]QOF98709.1 uroporphyrinogen-III C-methyltransferase [Stenotrophomonas sp. CW117]
MNDDSSPSSRRPMARWIIAILLLVALAAAAWFGWRSWQAAQRTAEYARAAAGQQLTALQQTVEALRRDQRANARGLQDVAATHRILRDEVLGLGQRNALLEENVARLADHSHQGAQAVRRDEAELLLSQAQQRLVYAGDLDGARHLYGLAAGVLESMDSPGYLNLRQALLQERSAIDALGPGVRVRTAGQLAQWAAALDSLPAQGTEVVDAQPAWWQQMLSPLVQIRPADPQVLVAGSERVAAGDALQVELTLARAALERGDSEGWRQALQRVDGWLLRLWPDSPQRRSQRHKLAELRGVDLRIALPELGSTLQQLRAMRDGKVAP